SKPWDGLVVAAGAAYVPPLFFPETRSLLRLKVHLRQLTPVDGERAFANLLRLDVRPWDPPDLQRRAWALAVRYDRSRTYDAQYLAVAEYLGCPLWTADRRLANAVREPGIR